MTCEGKISETLFNYNNFFFVSNERKPVISNMRAASPSPCSTSFNHVTVKMAVESWTQFVVLTLVVLLGVLTPGVHAFDAGDAIALILGLAIGIFSICACLGYYARRKGGA